LRWRLLVDTLGSSHLSGNYAVVKVLFSPLCAQRSRSDMGCHVTKAYQYTDLLACMLLDAWAIPVCMIITFIFLKARYHWTQILGVLVCVAGLGLTVVSENNTGKNYPGGENGLLPL
jgi:hypothetical protein